MIPANISSIDNKVLEIEVKAGKDSEQKYLKISNWNITSKHTIVSHRLGFNKLSMDIKLIFDNPLRISVQTSV